MIREIEEPEGYVLTPRDKDLHHSVFGPVAIIPRHPLRKNEAILISTTTERRISMKSAQLQQKRTLINGKVIVGIDPAKTKHQAAIIDTHGVQLGKSFSFDVSLDGYTRTLWQKLTHMLPTCSRQTTVFAIETSCNLWLTLAFYLHHEGYRVLLVSPLTTYHSRPMVNHDFSRTDPKDALLVASNARQGFFDLYEDFPPLSNAMHRLTITYCKLRRELAQNRARLRAALEQLFPEFLQIVEPDTQTALYLLKRYLFPSDFLHLDLASEANALLAISRKQYGPQTLLQLQKAAHHSIGVVKSQQEAVAERLSVTSWLTLIETLSAQMQTVFTVLADYAARLPEYTILRSLKGISDLTAALFLGELRDIHRFTHYKQLEKKAGLNLRLRQSGQYVGARHISHIGSKRLSWLLYTMTEETARWVPEVRAKYLRRQLHRRNHRKSVVASIPQLLKLIMVLVKEHREYQLHPDSVIQMHALEKQYSQLKRQRNTTKQAA
jgi:transposase